MSKSDTSSSGTIRIQIQQPERHNRVDTAIKKPKFVYEGQSLQELESKLDQLVGLHEAKKMIKEIYAWVYINKKRENLQLKHDPQALHMLFKGQPGTGKTTIARLIGELLKDMKILSKGHLVEAERADLVGEFIGQTAQKTRDLIKKAQGGILFIDEAYSLNRGGSKDFGHEAMDTLVKHMEDKKDEFIVIFAGYEHEMNRFLKLNPGLPSRIPIMLSFPPYTKDELMLIFKKLTAERDYRVTNELENKLTHFLTDLLRKDHPTFSNGRYMRNMLEKIMRQQALRLLREQRFEREDLLTLRACDFMIEDAAAESSEADEEIEE